MMAEFVIHLPIPPRGLHPNGRPHWRTKARLVKAYRLLAQQETFLQLKRRRPQLAEATVTLVYATKTGRRQDPDNLIAWAKAAIDGMTDAGLFRDDNQLTYLPARIEKRPPGSLTETLTVTVAHDTLIHI